MKVHYCTHKSPSPVTSHFLETHFNIILPSTLRSSKWSLSIRSLHQHPVCTCPVPHTCHIPSPSHSCVWCRIVLSTVTSSFLYPDMLLSTTFANTLSLCSSLKVCKPSSTPIRNKRQHYSCLRSRFQKFPAWHTKAAPNGKCCEGYSAICGEVNESVEKCVEIKGDYVEK